MKESLPSLDSHYAGRVTTIATCWHITRRDGEVFRYTDHPVNLRVDGETYLGGSGYTASSIQSSSALSVDDLEIDGALDSATITEDDLLAGKWDHAEVRIFEVNYTNTAQGKRRLRRGWIGEVRTAGIGFTCELRGMMQRFAQSALRIVSARCDARVGDARCGLDLDAITDGRITATVTSVTDSGLFVASSLTQATNWFDFGVLAWNTGASAGLEAEVRTFTSGGTIELVEPMYYAVANGDEFTIEVGCDGSLATCRDKFNNVINRRAFDFVPGTNKLISNE